MLEIELGILLLSFETATITKTPHFVTFCLTYTVIIEINRRNNGDSKMHDIKAITTSVHCYHRKCNVSRNININTK